MDDEAVEAAVGNQQIAAAAEDEYLQLALAGELDRLEQGVLGRDLAEETRRPTDAQGGVRSKRDVLLQD